MARRHGAGAAVFAALGVFYWTAHSMMRPLVGTYVLSLGGTEVDASIALASFSIFPTVLAVLIGGFVDSWGGRPLLIAGGSLMLTGGALMVIPDLTTVVISQVLLGLGTLCVWVSLQASITSATGGLSRDDRARRIATFTVFVSFGQMVGPAVGGALQSLGGYVVAYSAYATLSLALLIVAIAAAPRSTVQRQGRGIPIIRPYAEAAALLKNRPVVIAVLLSFTALMLHDIRSAWQPLLLHGAGLEQWQIGLVISASALAGFGARPFFAPWLRVLGVPLFAGLVVVIGATTAMLATVAPGNMTFLIAIGVVNGLAVGFAQPLSLTLLSDEVPPTQLGIASGLRSAGNQAALLASPAAFGAVAALSSLSVAFLVVGGAAALVGVVSAALLHFHRPASPPDGALDLPPSGALDVLVEGQASLQKETR
ncbi:MFS transporter [Salinibacterium sp. GXW1014]|uniref:MFS transporter n=1 Tax=Salinibacterium sp. GXW1014 TaxID=3377838 RepID=UPI00383B144B